MIIKAKSHRHANPRSLFDRLINYLIDDKGHSKEKTAWSFFHNLSSYDSKGVVDEFVENAKLKKQRKNSVLAHHYILSFHELDSDKVTPEIMQDLVKKFLELRNEKGIAFARVHDSQKHPHIHILISANQFGSSKSTRMSRNDFLEVHRKLEEYQLEKYPEISHSLVKIRARKKNPRIISDKEKPLTETENKMKKRLGKTPTKKETLKVQLQSFMSRSNSTKEFYDLLEKHGFNIYTQRDKIRGFLKDGKKFRFSTLGISKGMIRELMSERERRFEALQKSRTHNINRNLKR